ncbi:hypothetical protein W1240910_161 [Cyanophage S-RIM12_W1_24_0910]|uniref:Uncharacterized protein n=2 Tax=Brizovirus TaxID=2733098 RepID=A0A1D7SWZ4_9CAUD|nr:hypothetical protein HOQ64_gp073 [Cyanophage S-RIM12 isolate RW_01_0310]AOO15861.1 hypothetical protein RW010310_160 [Cyanophage S-RIM12 isolate RW_01_0310]AOO18224.1 hypothetical protein Sn070910_159 [Cyanophage S-RIM12_Sn_07_0910]AOO18438.1 hypothetical protein Sn310910_161 [Cyanophage S-RIM12_Sn_31_0910]AOO19081.1 hypothetical protein W1240910_161 [Cyanophage S-RIM12_W1_24_0910]
MEIRKNSIAGVLIRMKQTKFIVTYQKAFSAGAAREEKLFDELKDAQWFERAMKRSQHITTLLEVKE